MASEKYVGLVGVGEEDTAHLRLLLRAAGGQLANRWRWGNEDNADLLIVDPSVLAGQIGRNRAFSSGRRCVVMSDSEVLRDGEERLPRPFKADALVSVLNNAASTAEVRSTTVNEFANDFYDIGNFELDMQLEETEVAEARAHQREETPALGLDELFKPDVEASSPQFAVPAMLDAETSLSHVTKTSLRSDNRFADSIQAQRKIDEKAEGINFGPRNGTSAAASGLHPLRDFLSGNLLGGPSTLSFDNAPALTLDPKEKQFASPGTLRQLSVYCQRDFARDAFRAVTSQELARQRAEYGVYPYSRLIWLDVLLLSGGQLSRTLDPGGRYKLKVYPKAEKDFPKHFAIVAALQQPAKLNEIAATARASMGEVFDVVNAYDAIGLIEVERRAPRHAEPDQPSGLMARLRNPFGRR
ncbi:MAG: hypothetical protein ABJB01_11550 [Rudaea sp.]